MTDNQIDGFALDCAAIRKYVVEFLRIPPFSLTGATHE